MVGFQILVKVSPDKRQEFLHTFNLLTRADHRSRHCIGQCLFEDVGETNCFLWSEVWNDSKTMETHLNTDRFRSLLGAIDVLGTLEEMHKVTFKAV
jgi:quinol monooxygenase YgiN